MTKQSRWRVTLVVSVVSANDPSCASSAHQARVSKHYRGTRVNSQASNRPTDLLKEGILLSIDN